jgi:hypothetical protein
MPLLMHCFTDADVRRGIAAVIGRGDRCVICDGDHDDAHDAHPHPFVPADLLDLFLEAARETRDRTEHDGVVTLSDPHAD